jgi:hypothetical protein
MNRSTFVSRASAQHPLAELQEHEREARRLNAEASIDKLTQLVVAYDLWVRRLAYRVADRLQGSSRTPPPSRVR